MAAAIRIRKRTASKSLSNSCASAISEQIRHKTCEIDGEKIGETCALRERQAISLDKGAIMYTYIGFGET